MVFMESNGWIYMTCYWIS